MATSSKLLQLASLLRDGRKHTVADIMNALWIGDPRSAIRDLRNKGVEVQDEYITSLSGARYKRYWIDRKEE